MTSAALAAAAGAIPWRRAPRPALVATLARLAAAVQRRSPEGRSPGAADQIRWSALRQLCRCVSWSCAKWRTSGVAPNIYATRSRTASKTRLHLASCCALSQLC